jgi:hypothetical protein
VFGYSRKIKHNGVMKAGALTLRPGNKYGLNQVIGRTVVVSVGAIV